MRIPRIIRATFALALSLAVLATAEARPVLTDDNTSNNKAGKDHRDRDKNDKSNDKSSDKSAKDGAGASGEVSGADDEEKKKTAQQQEQILPRGATILVGDRTVTGPFSSPQVRGKRIFLPVVSIARTLGDQIIVNPAARTVEVRRQTGVVAEFNAQINQVREDGAVILAVSSTADIIFSPNPEELMLPVEIVAPLFDVSIVVDEGRRAVKITRGRSISSRTVVNHAPWELYQVDYAYNLNLYSTSYYQNLAVNAHGRINDGRFTLVTNLDGGTGSDPFIYRRGTFTYDTPDGRRLVAGDFGTGNDLSFLSSTVRGALVQRPYAGARLTAFAGRSSSGVLPSLIDDPLTGLPFENKSRFDLTYDTNVLGSYATFGPSALNPSGPIFLLFSTGGMYFSGPQSSGQMATGSIKYSNERHQFLGDVAAGSFNGFTSDSQRAEGFAAVLDVSEVFNLSESVTLQGRFAHISPNFLNPQAAGAFNPVRLAQGGISWRPFRSFGASLNSSSVKRLDRDDQTDRSITGTASITPSSRWLPTLLLTHTHTSNSLGGSSAYTLINATRELNRLRLFGNFTRTRNLTITSLTDRSRIVETPPGMTLTAGAIIKLNESHILQASQSFGSRGSLSGDFDWMTSRFFTRRISLGAGFGYSQSGNTFSTTTRFLTAIELPGQQIVQLSYAHTATGPQLLLQLRGPFLKSRRAEAAQYAPLSEIRALGAFYGRVYQDVNLNGRFDAGIDLPQSDVQVRVDGNFYAASDRNGEFRLDSIRAGEHIVYLDLLSVRADLTLLDSHQQTAVLQPGQDTIIDFRLVRTGRIRGVVWMDLDGNGRMEPDETPLSDVRIVTSSGRDTLTDSQGEFILGDLPPGEHTLLIDEKTLPDGTRSAHVSLQVRVKAGGVTEDVMLPVINKPSEINVKRFPSSGH